MADPVIRFVHAADLQLHEPCSGMLSVPEPLQATFIDAPFAAAQRVFDAAVAEKVDFVVLAGNVVHPYLGGARAISFLLDQFCRLERHETAVYWSAGPDDAPDQWPASVDLPDNVYRFRANGLEEKTHTRGGKAVAQLIGIGNAEGGELPLAGLPVATGTTIPRIVVTWGLVDGDALSGQPIDYWALGGPHERKTLFSRQQTAHYCGTPQGRTPAQTGPHGCSLVTVNADRRTRIQHVVTDSVRFRRESLRLPAEAARGDLERALREKTQLLTTENSDRPVVVSWDLELGGRLASQFRRQSLDEQLASWLNQQYGTASPPVWSADLRLVRREAPPAAWYEEDTILGDFLRSIRQMEADDSLALDLREFLRDSPHRSLLKDCSVLDERLVCMEVLREVTAMGGDLLKPES